MSTYSWSSDLKELWSKLQYCVSAQNAFKIMNDNQWQVVTPYKVDYKIRPNSYFMSDIEFLIETVTGKLYTLTFREDVVESTIRTKLEFLDGSSSYGAPPTPRCTCGLDGAGLGGRHSRWCTFGDLYTIGKDAERRAKELKEKKD